MPTEPESRTHCLRQDRNSRCAQAMIDRDDDAIAEAREHLAIAARQMLEPP
jgi:hypothetical protein